MRGNRRAWAGLIVAASLATATPAAGAATTDDAWVEASAPEGRLGETIVVTGGCPVGADPVVAHIRLEIPAPSPPPVPGAPTPARVPSRAEVARMTSLAPHTVTGTSTPVAGDGTFAVELALAVDLEPGGRRVRLHCVEGGGDITAGAYVPFELRAADPPLPTNTWEAAEEAEPGDPLPVSGTARIVPGRVADTVEVHLVRTSTRWGWLPEGQLSVPVAGDGTFAGQPVLPAALRPGGYELRVVLRAGDQWVGSTGASSRLAVRGPRFEDVPDGSPHAAAIARLADNGASDGCAAGRFCPRAPITRAQFAAMVARTLDIEHEVGGSVPLTFADVRPGSAHATAIAQLAATGRVEGCTASRFCPGEAVRRDQAVSILNRVDHHVIDPSRTRFVDVPPTSPHDLAIHRALAEGRVEGCAPRRFCPKEQLTRAQAAALLSRWAWYWDR